MTTLRLTYVPISGSIHLYLNGQQTHDWTFDPPTNSVVTNSSVGETTGDRMEARYAHAGVVAP